jgi:RNA polymerase sigma factor (sigma-70 family)
VDHDTNERLEDLETLARRYEHRVRLFARQVEQRLLLGSHWSDDLVSAGYWGLYKALRNRRAEAAEQQLSAYVSLRIRGAVLDEARACINRNIGRQIPTSPERLDAEVASPSPPWTTGALANTPATPEHAVSVRRRWSQVSHALEQLPPEQRRLIRSYMDGSSIPEIAQAEGVPIPTMRDRFRKIARTLRGRAPHLRRILLDG